MESIDSLVEAIDAFPGAVVIVTHSEMILNAIAKRLIVFDGGEPRFFMEHTGIFWSVSDGKMKTRIY